MNAWSIVWLVAGSLAAIDAAFGVRRCRASIKLANVTENRTWLTDATALLVYQVAVGAFALAYAVYRAFVS